MSYSRNIISSLYEEKIKISHFTPNLLPSTPPPKPSSLQDRLHSGLRKRNYPKWGRNSQVKYFSSGAGLRSPPVPPSICSAFAFGGFARRWAYRVGTALFYQLVAISQLLQLITVISWSSAITIILVLSSRQRSVRHSSADLPSIVLRLSFFAAFIKGTQVGPPRPIIIDEW